MVGDDFARHVTALLVIAPHPDDEVLGCGWLMRSVARAGGHVVIAWLTDGGGSHGPGADRAALVARRRAEATAGLDALGIAPIATYRLDAPDGGLAEFSTPTAKRAWLRRICATHAIDMVAVTAGDDSHPDHRAAFALVQQSGITQSYAYPISARYDGDLPRVPDDAARIGPFADADKRRALACHASQTAAEGAVFPLSAAAIARFCSMPELFYPMTSVT